MFSWIADDILTHDDFVYPGLAAGPFPAQPQFLGPAHSPQFTQGSGSDQTASWKEWMKKTLGV